MKKETKSKNNINRHIDSATNALNQLLNSYLNDEILIDKADKLSYWIEDYCGMLSNEKNFTPSALIGYKRGDIIKVNLGYRVGNEQGGLHYCIVLDKENSKNSGIITIIPLKSDKGKKLHYTEVNLGKEIYMNFIDKYNHLYKKYMDEIDSSKIVSSKDELREIREKLQLLKKIKAEIDKMNKGTIALVGQITTISKLRIYDPQKTGDILYGLRVSPTTLDLINEKICRLYIKKLTRISYIVYNIYTMLSRCICT